MSELVRARVEERLVKLRLGAVEDVSESAPLSAALLGADAATLQPMTASD